MLFDVRRILLAACSALAFGASCASAPDASAIIEGWRAAGPDSGVITSLGALNPRQSCFIDAFVKDSLPGTPCMTKCIRDGAGYGMGGGCWHACYAYTSVPMPDPARFNHCPAEAAPPPQAPPVLECFRNAPSRSLTILFLDAASGAPLPNAAVVEPVVEYADTTGYLQLDSLPGGRFALAGHSMGFLESSISLSLGAREACVVLFRLRPASGWGF